jgi:hypothetical protein
VRAAAISKVVWIIWLEPDRFIKIDEGTVVLARLPERYAAIEKGLRVFWI